MTVLALSILAIGALKTYNDSKRNDPEGTEGKIHSIKQSTSVVLAIGEAIWAVLDALMFLTRSRQSSSAAATNSTPLRPPGFGQRVAADAEG
jgi:hypothetical protein